jgi:hypothetical protein
VSGTQPDILLEQVNETVKWDILFLSMNCLMMCLTRRPLGHLILGLLCVTVRLSLNFIIGCWGYTLDKSTKLVSGETCGTVLHSS